QQSSPFSPQLGASVREKSHRHRGGVKFHGFALAFDDGAAGLVAAAEQASFCGGICKMRVSGRNGEARKPLRGLWPSGLRPI
ncbi:MAG: hypothetical protein JW709_04175, partial [Sedimentisphaerales bacterium]|nr:hypothetical protein [Sedimentisphaerales bacterium]